MAQGRQNTVVCTQPGCGKFLKKENLTRHTNEIHKRKIKARCKHCGKEFTRPYLKKEHVRKAKCRVAILSEDGKDASLECCASVPFEYEATQMR